MSANQLPVTYGTILGTPVVGQCSSDTLQNAVFITLNQPYVRNAQGLSPGYPTANAGAEIKVSVTNAPQTIPASTRFLCFDDEALAIQSLGYGTIG